MRWFWIDRFTEFVSGERATALKNISLAEEHLHDHFPGAPTMPNALIVEGLAQTGGLLVGEMSGFRERVVLGKIVSAKFHSVAVPGDTLTYRVTLENFAKESASVRGTSSIGDRLQGEVELFFVQLDENFVGDQPLFDPNYLLAMLQQLCLYEVGRTQDGQRLTLPPLLSTAAG
jgi:3-hydroxyacyl-[acyl-carrier-protein] dehydratase